MLTKIITYDEGELWSIELHESECNEHRAMRGRQRINLHKVLHSGTIELREGERNGSVSDHISVE
ncbi:MAG: hypothetical protein IKU98_00115 [Bacteroidaceae bacterium]|nr:hypothetical protein [Bacteroidaceae bacterium]